MKKIKVELTDSWEVFKTMFINNMSELETLNEEAKRYTAGNVFWRVAPPSGKPLLLQIMGK